MADKSFKAEFIRALGILAVTLGEEISEERVLAYYEIFRSHEPKDVLTALKLAMTTCKYFPKPAELIELMTGGKGGGQDPATAWAQVLRNLEHAGVYESPEFEDGAIAAAIEGLGGWVELGRMNYEQITLQRIPARFEALYREAVRQGRHMSPGKVAGLVEVQNNANGFESFIPAPVNALSQDEIMNRARLTSSPALPAPDPLPLSVNSRDETKQILGEIDADIKRISQRKAM